MEYPIDPGICCLGCSSSKDSFLHHQIKGLWIFFRGISTQILRNTPNNNLRLLSIKLSFFRADPLLGSFNPVPTFMQGMAWVGKASPKW